MSQQPSTDPVLTAFKKFFSILSDRSTSILLSSFGIASTAFLFWKYFTNSKPSTSVDKTHETSSQPRNHHSFSSNEELIQHLKNSTHLSPILEKIFTQTDRGKYAVDVELENSKDLEVVRPYADAAMPLRCNATISAPHIHVTCLNAFIDVFEQASQNKHDPSALSTTSNFSCLDVGSGSGFVSAALCHLSEYFDLNAKILAIDHIQELVDLGFNNVQHDENSNKFLQTSTRSSSTRDIQLIFKKGNGYDSQLIRTLFNDSFRHSEFETPNHSEPLFDIIHVGAACPSIPKHLYELLKPNGRIICPVGPSIGTQELLCICKSEKKNSTITKLGQEHGEDFAPTTNIEHGETTTQMLVQCIAKVHFVPLFSNEQDQERHFNRSNPKVVVNPNTGEKFIVLPYLHLCGDDSKESIKSLQDIKWQGDE
ncbi:hypothetical protein C9374_000715 [Naegleria lovaniensis]|uniref:protein-L-isoaspartate(D-aspartate) O-methyltransferase n=1 Tax=Naegleria lovaniensis TaxID=51637 RepID=A0AA88GYY3_NAELO|nr:uncharacterized protein C9374_000715 [Naegleria lovaniensis]KAG2388551.1 hypothetical protein C9374_000715 [Naegleria lovaniensis]